MTRRTCGTSFGALVLAAYEATSCEAAGHRLSYFSVAVAAVAATIRVGRAGGRPCRGKIDAVAIYRSLKRAMPARSCYGEAVFASGEHTLELLTSRGTTGNVATSMGFQ